MNCLPYWIACLMNLGCLLGLPVVLGLVCLSF